MLRALLIFIFFLLIFLGVVIFFMQAPGIASFSYADITVELPLLQFVIGVIIIFATFYLVLRLLSLLFSIPRRIHTYTLRRKQSNTIEDLKEGLTKFILGDWQHAEKLLLRASENRDIAGISYMWAARAAHLANRYVARDQHLSMAKESTPKAHAALDVLQAELLLEQGLPEQGLANISQRSKDIRSNPKIATLFAKAYVQLHDWQKLAGIMPDLKKTKDLNKHFLTQIEKQATQEIFSSGNEKLDSGMLERTGLQFKEVISGDSVLMVKYVETLRLFREFKTAASFITSTLEKNWNTELAYQYGLLEFADPAQAIKKAEQWARHHAEDANVLLTLGRLCKRAQLWGKAKSYLESSLLRTPLPETYAELATLHEQLDEHDDAHLCAKKGLELAIEPG